MKCRVEQRLIKAGRTCYGILPQQEASWVQNVREKLYLDKHRYVDIKSRFVSIEIA